LQQELHVNIGRSDVRVIRDWHTGVLGAYIRLSVSTGRTGTRRRRTVRDSIQIMTGVEVIIENVWPKVRKMLPEIEDRGQHLRTEREKI